jgi:hypothetical protein
MVDTVLVVHTVIVLLQGVYNKCARANLNCFLQRPNDHATGGACGRHKLYRGISLNPGTVRYGTALRRAVMYRCCIVFYRTVKCDRITSDEEGYSEKTNQSDFRRGA